MNARNNPDRDRVKRYCQPAGGVRTRNKARIRFAIDGGCQMIESLIHTARVSLVFAVAALVCVGLAGGRAAADEDVATFEITVDISWSADTASFEFPVGGHMSGLTGATHNQNYVLFRDGHTASSGLELVAENGRVATLRAEFAEAKRRRRIGSMIDGPELKQVPGRIAVKFTTTKDHPLLSFVTMIAPSPDWFTGVADVNLLKDGNWIDGTELTLWAWDSGTDSGRTYQAKDVDTQPQQSVRLLATSHFLTDSGMVPMGSATIKRIASQ